MWLTGEIVLSDPPPKRAIPERLNPVFKGKLNHYTKDDLDAWRDLIHNHILEFQPTGTKPITLLWTGSLSAGKVDDLARSTGIPKMTKFFLAALRAAIVLTLAVSQAHGSVQTIMDALARAGSAEPQYKAALNQAWNKLAPKQQQVLDGEQREWVNWKNNELDRVERTWATKQRADYIARLVAGQDAAQVQADMIADATEIFQVVWALLTPALQQKLQEPVEAFLEAQVTKMPQWYKKLTALHVLAANLPDIPSYGSE